MLTHKTSEILAIVVVVAFAFLVGTYNVDKASIEAKGYQSGYSAGYKAAWNNATAIVDSVQMPIFQVPANMLSVSGKIVNIADNSLTLEADPVSTNPLSEDSKPTIRVVKIIPSTKIVKIAAKAPEEIQAMLSQNATFLPFSEEEITFSQLKEGDLITATSDKSIKREMEISALKITLH